MTQIANPAALPDESRMAGAVTTFLACFLSLSAPLMTHVLEGYYGFGAIEAWAAFALVAAFAAIYAAFHSDCRPTVQRGLETVFIILLADLYFDSRFVPVLIGLAWLVLGLFLKIDPHRFLVAFGGAALLVSIATGLIERKPWISAVADHSAKASRVTSTGPAIVHIILDEHIGLAGLPQSPKGQQTARELQDFYATRGFTTYSRAYSRHLHSTSAVPDILNFGRRLGLTGNREGGVTGPTDYFTGLRAAGYALTIYQSNFLILCKGADESLCVTYDRTSLQPIGELGLSASDRLTLLMARYLGASRMLSVAFEYYRSGNLGAWAENRSRPPSLDALRSNWSTAGLRAMELFVDGLRDARPGNAYFIHATFPHFPYLTTRDCAVKAVSEWRQRKEWQSPTEQQAAYYEQLHCSMRFVERTIAAVNQSPAGENAIIIVHSDHGSRIAQEDPTEESRGRIERDQMISTYSTLFAVRLPGQQARNDSSLVLASNLLQALVQSNFKAAPKLPAETRPSVILNDAAWRPTRPHDLPTDW